MQSSVVKRLSAALLGGVFFVALAARGQIFVNQTSTNIQQDGRSWATAYHELRDVLTPSFVRQANSSGQAVEIWVASGTYKPTSGTNRSISFPLCDHLRLRGGFAGVETSPAQRLIALPSDRLARIIYTNMTVLSGDIGARQTDGVTSSMRLASLGNYQFNSTSQAYEDNSENVLTASNVTDVVLDGLIVTGGYAAVATNILTAFDLTCMVTAATNSTMGQTVETLDNRVAGGGLFFVNAPGWYLNQSPTIAAPDLTVSNCIFVGNGARGFGGGMAVREAYASLSGCEFVNNFSEYEGGAYWGQNQLNFTIGSYFQNNWSYRSGGAVHLESIPSFRTVNPFNQTTNFSQVFGLSEAEAVLSCQSYQGAADLSIDLIQAGLLQDGFPGVRSLNPNMQARLFPSAHTFGNTLLSSYAKNGANPIYAGPDLEKAFATRFSSAKFMLGSAMSALQDIDLTVDASDILVQTIADFPGVTNSPGFTTFINGWDTFFVGFSTYATPGGWLSLLENSIESLFGLGSGPSYEEIAQQYRAYDITFYNAMPKDGFLFCQFVSNQTAGVGGALLADYDQIQIEDSLIESNSATANGGGAAFMGGSLPVLVSDALMGNYSREGHSAMVSAFRVQPHILNCTIVNNGSGGGEGFALDNELGADTFLGNSILWGNTNADPDFASGGADIYTATESELDTNTLNLYNQAGDSHFLWIGICDVHDSCVQSLNSTPLGQDDYFLSVLVDGNGLSYDPEGAFSIADGLGMVSPSAYENAGRAGAYSFFYNLGEGTRQTLANPSYANSSLNPGPFSTNGTVSPGSSIINRGDLSLISNTENYPGPGGFDGFFPVIDFDWSVTGRDLWQQPRFGNFPNGGAAIDLGAVQNSSLDSQLLAALGPISPFDALAQPASFQFGAASDFIYPTTYSGGSLPNLYVNASVSGGNGSGSSWANAMRQIPTNPTNLFAQGVIWVAAGAYNIPSVIRLQAGMSIYGGFHGGETDLLQSDPIHNPTIITGGGALPALITLTNGGGFTVQGLTFTGLNTSGNGVGLHAGGSATIQNCIFARNLGSCADGVPAANFISCQFLNNSASDSAPILSVTDAVVQNCVFVSNSFTVKAVSSLVTGCRFTNNFAGLLCTNSNFSFPSVINGCQFNANAYGLATDGGTVTNCGFTGNLAGALTTSGDLGPTLVAGCAFLDNAAPAALSDGGTFTNDSFIGNTEGPASGAALILSLGLAQDCLFQGNFGLAAAADQDSSFANCVFLDNATNAEATNSALQITGGSVNGCVFQDNTGPAVLALGDSGNEAQWYDCRFLGNTGGPAMTSQAGFLLMQNCLFQGNSSADSAGALALDGAGATYIFGSEFFENIGGLSAGAIDSELGQITLVNCTVYSNLLTDPTAQGGAGVLANNTSYCQLQNTILSGNRLTGNPSISLENQQFLGSGPAFVNTGVLSFLLETSIVEGLTDLGQPLSNLGSFDANPLFVNGPSGNLQLQPASPAIAAGSSTNAIYSWLLTPADRAGHPWALNSHVDIGAFAFVGVPVPRASAALNLFQNTPCDGLPSFTIAANLSAAGVLYQWQVNTLDGTGFHAVGNGGIYSNVTTLHLQIIHPPSSMGGYLYRIVSVAGSPVEFVSSNVALPRFKSILYVNRNVASGGTGDGSSWANAMTDLQFAIQQAHSCSQIWVAEGTYSPSGALGPVGFYPGPDVQLYGGFEGTETNLAQRDRRLYPTILQSDNSPTLELTAPGIDAMTVVDGFTIEYAGSLAAIDVQGGNPTLRNCTVLNSAASGLYLGPGPAPTLVTNCQFLNCSNTAVFSSGGSGTFLSDLFSGNQSGYGSAGAFYSQISGATVFSNCQFYANQSPWAGAVYNDQGTALTLTRCALLNNSGGQAGAVDNRGMATINNSLMASNSSAYAGALYQGGNLSMAFCTIVNNFGGYGAIDVNSGTWTADSCILWGNQGPQVYQFGNATPYTNLAFSIIQGIYNDPNDPVYRSRGDLGVYPIFVNDSADFHLLQTSPAIGSGDPLLEGVGTDLDGNIRALGKRVDIGCYQDQFGSPATPIDLVMVPTNQTICSLTPGVFQIAGPQGSANTYQWQEFNGVAYTNIAPSSLESIGSDGTTNSLTLANSSAFNGAQFQVVVNGQLSLPFAATVGAPDTIYVNASAPPGGDGTRWSSAFQSFSQALASAGSCDQIWVAAGTYLLTNLPNAEAAHLSPGVQIFGGFVGGEASLVERNFALNVTGLVPSATNSTLLLAVPPSDFTAVLDGFYLSGAVTALDMQSAGATIRNCVFESNSQAISAYECSGAQISNCVFRMNGFQAGSVVGLLAATNVELVNCTITNNVGASVIGLEWGSGVVFSNLLVASNSAASGLTINDTALSSLANCTFASNSFGVGAAVFSSDSPLTLTNCAFLANQAEEASLYVESGTRLAAERCIFRGNLGPAFTASFTTIFLGDSLVVQNQSVGLDGAILTEFCSGTLINDTIADNVGAAEDAEGIVDYSAGLNVVNCILWNNGAPGYAGLENSQLYGVRSASYTLIKGLSRYQDPARNNIPYAPLFLSEGANYELSSNSPAINVGNPSGVSTSGFDLAGNSRLHGGKIDLGAYSFLNASSNTLDLSWNLTSESMCGSGGLLFYVSNASPSALSVQWLVNSGLGFVPITNNTDYTIAPLSNSFGVNSGGSSLAIAYDPALSGSIYEFVIPNINYTSAPATLTMSPTTVVYVDAAATGRGDGTSWANAFTKLSDAFGGGGCGVALWVATGVYKENEASLAPEIQIYGGFPRGGNMANRNPVLYPTILESAAGAEGPLQQTQPDIPGQRSLIDGIDFRASEIALFCWPGCNPASQNCRFDNCNTAIVCSGGALSFSNCAFSSNNTALSMASNSIATLTGCSFSNHTYTAVQCNYSQVAAANCVFLNNSGFNGGALLLLDSGASIQRSVFAGNSALEGGAISSQSSSALALSDCLLDGNAASEYGGAIDNYGTVSLVNCTLASNTADLYAGAVSQEGGRTLILNSILWGNTSFDAPNSAVGEILRQGGTIQATNNIFEFSSGIPGAGLLNLNPLFSTNYALSPRSPAVDAGINAVLPPNDTDLAGNARIQDGIVDLGAYESPYSANPVPLLTVPQSAFGCVGQSAFFSLSSPAPNAYQWQYNLGSGWATLSNGGVISGVSASISASNSSSGSGSMLTLTNLNTQLNGLLIQASLGGLSYTTAVATLSIDTNDIIYVDTSAPPGGNGATWATAFTSLIDGLNASSACQPILWVAGGSYAPTNSQRDYGQFYIPNGVSIYGGFPSGGGGMASRNWTTHPTMLVNMGGSQGVFLDGVESNTILDGLTVVGGPAITGIVVAEGSPTLRNLRVENCGQSGLMLTGSSSLIENCQFVNNTSQGAGGGAAVLASAAIFLNCAFQGNHTETSGGAIYTQGGHPQFLDTLISGNFSLSGAAVEALGSATLINCTIADNWGVSTGAIDLAGADNVLAVTNSIVWGNAANDASPEQQQVSTSGFGNTLSLANSAVYGLSTLGGPGVVGADPTFVSSIDAFTAPSTNGNFRLEPCSPLINIGSPSADSFIALDLDGNSRIAAGKVDLGCYENGNPTVTPLAITSQPRDLAYSYGSATNQFSVAASGDGLSYQWQLATAGAPFAALQDGAAFSGSTTPTLQVGQISPALNGSLVRCQVTTSEGCAAVSSVAVLTLFPQILYVNAATTNFTDDGLSWATAFSTLAQATAARVNPAGTQIWVVAGNYEAAPLQTGDLLYGGFSGTETNLNQRNWQANRTVIVPTNSYDYVPGGPPAAVVAFTLGQPQAVSLARIDGFGINTANTCLLCQPNSSGITIANCQFDFSDTAIRVENPAPLQITNCQFGYLNVGLEILSGNVALSHSAFVENTEGILQGGGSLALRDCALSNNWLGFDYLSGGLSIQRCAFRGNGSALAPLGVVSSGALAFEGSGNHAVEVEDSLFSGNYAPEGGAVNDDGVSGPVFRNCTFADNANTAIYAFGGSVSLYNCVVWGNIDTNYSPYYWVGTNYAQIFGALAQQSNNIIENGLFAIDPSFVSPIDALTVPNNSGNFQLTACSPILDLGDTNLIGSSQADLNGSPRTYNGSVAPGAYQPAVAPFGFSLQPTNVTAVPGNIVTFNAAVDQPSVADYNWQVSVNGGPFVGLANVSPYIGVSTTNLQFPAGASENGNAYRLSAIYLPSGCSIVSQPAVFTYFVPSVTPPKLTDGILALPSTNISFTLAGGFDAASLGTSGVAAFGNQSGLDALTSLLQPARPFHSGEQVSVTVTSSLETSNNFAAIPRTFEFFEDVTSWNGNFDTPNILPINGANLVQAGDLNSDGAIDLFVSTAGGCRIWTNNGAAQFADSGQNLGTSAASQIILGDLRGVGNLDAVLVRKGNVEIWTNSGAGLFALMSVYSAVAITNVALADLNQDGSLDLFALTATDNRVWWNDGSGHFADSGMRLPGANTVGSVIGDFNEDGALDVYVVHSDASPGQLWLNQGGSFSLASGQGLPAAAGGYDRILAGYLSGRGHLDLVTMTGNQLQVWAGDGTGSFTPYWQAPATNAGAISIGDLNGDHVQDLVFADTNGALQAYTAGAGAFEALPYQGPIANATSAALADLSGDGALDLAAVDTSGRILSAIYLPTELYASENSGPNAIDLSVFAAQAALRYPSDSFDSVTIVQTPTNGTLLLGQNAVSANQIITLAHAQQNGLYYVPAPNQSGRDSFVWRTGEPTLFQFNITTASAAIVQTTNSYASVSQGGSVSFLTNGYTSVLQNDHDFFGDTLQARLLQAPAHGTVVFNSNGAFTYIHDGSESHFDYLTYSAYDSAQNVSATAYLYIVITNVNHTPDALTFASAPLYDGVPAGQVVGQLTATDPDPAVGGYTFSLVPGLGDTNNSLFVISNNFVLTAAPLEFPNGATLSLRIQAADLPDAYDAGGSTIQAAFSITVFPQPTAYAQSLQTPENSPGLPILLTGSGLQPLSYHVVNTPAHGALSGTAPNLFYKPNPDFFGLDNLVFYVTDGVRTSAVATVTITVPFVDEAPSVANAAITTLENTPTNLVLPAAPFLASNALAYQIVTPPAGQLLGPATNLIYIPPTNYYGGDWFTFTTSDGVLTSAVATVTIQIVHVPAPPVAVSLTNQVLENSSVTFFLQGHDVDDYNPVSYQIATPPHNGALVGLSAQSQGRLTYKPSLNFSGADSFTYVANNGSYDSAPATVLINVAPLPTPVAYPQTVATTQGQPVNIVLGGANLGGYTNLVLAYAIDSGPAHGSLAASNNITPNFAYTPSSIFYGTDSFTYHTYVANFASSQATIQINVQPLPPSAVSGVYTNYGGLQFAVLSGSDPNGLPVSYQMITAPTNGSLSGANLPGFYYTPNSNYYGTDGFAFDVYDANGTSSVATVTFVMVEPSHPPTVGYLSTNAFVGFPITVPLSLLASDSAGDPLTITGVSRVSRGTATFTSNSVTYTATTNSAVPNGGEIDGAFAFVVSNRFQTTTGLVTSLNLDRHLIVQPGSFGPGVFQGDAVMFSSNVSQAVNIANSYGPSLPWVITVPVVPGPGGSAVEFTNAQAIAADGSPSALDVTGNICLQGIVPEGITPSPYYPTNLALICAPVAGLPLRLAQVEPGATLCLSNCIVSGGNASDGGALYNGGTLQLLVTTLSNNSASLGGAVFNLNGIIAATNSEIVSNTAAFGGGVYQLGDSARAVMVASNTLITGNLAAQDVVSTNIDGGVSSITSTLLTIGAQTPPFFAPLAPSYLFSQNPIATLSAAFDPSQFSFSASPVVPWNDGSALNVVGIGSEKRLVLSPMEQNAQTPRLVSLTLAGRGLSYTENFTLAVDPGQRRPPLAANYSALVSFAGGSVAIPVLANDVNPDGPQSQLAIVSAGPAQFGAVAIVGNEVVYAPTNFYTVADTFQYVVSNGSLSSTGTVSLAAISLLDWNFFATSFEPESAADSGPGTLREAIGYLGANYLPAGATISLGSYLGGSSIILSTADSTDEGPSAFVISNSMTIDGGAFGVTLEQATNAPPMRFFHVLPGATLVLSNLTLAGGVAFSNPDGPGYGGAIYNEGTVDLEGVTILGCSAESASNLPGLGGAIFSTGSVILNGSTLTNNSSSTGGGIFQWADANEVSISMTNSYLDNREAAFDLAAFTTNGGAASTMAVESTILNPAAPWISELDNITLAQDNSLPIYVGQNSPSFQISATSDNTNVLPSSGLTLSGSNNLRYVNIRPTHNGVTHLLVTAAEPDLSFTRGITVGVVGSVNFNPVAPDYFLQAYPGQILTIPIVTNDYDLGSAPLALLSVSPASSGTVAITNNELIYANAGGVATNDFFSYVVTNTFGGAAVGRVFVSVVPARLSILNDAPSGAGSLSNAMSLIAASGYAGPWTIDVDPSLAGQTVSLTQYAPTRIIDDFSAFIVTNSLTIDASSAPGFTLAVPDNLSPGMRFFQVNAGAQLNLIGLTLSDGTAFTEGSTNIAGLSVGGGIVNLGTLYASNLFFENNRSSSGGAIYNLGSATIVDSTFAANAAFPSGGAIYNDAGSVVLANDLFTNNAGFNGDAVFNDGNGAAATLSLQNVVMTNSVGDVDLTQRATNGGTVSILNFQTNRITALAPSIGVVADQVVSNAVSIPFSFAQISPNAVLGVGSSNPEALPLSNIVLATNVSGGLATIAPGSYAGNSEVSIRITDGAFSYAQLFNVTVLGQPAPTSESFQTTANQAVSFDVLAAYAGSGLFVSSVDTNGLLGRLTVAANGQCSYNPRGAFDSLAPGATAADTFSCLISAANESPAAFAISIVVTGVEFPPVAGSVLLVRAPNQAAQVSISDLLAASSDSSPAPVFFDSFDNISSRGASIVQTNDLLLYTMRLGDNVDDQFGYSVYNLYGQVASGTVLVDVVRNLTIINPGSSGSANLYPGSFLASAQSIVRQSADILMQFHGQPGAAYQVQDATTLPVWTTVGTAVADGGGLIWVRDVAPTNSHRFYRVILAP